jgi:hypothetical protein
MTTELISTIAGDKSTSFDLQKIESIEISQLHYPEFLSSDYRSLLKKARKTFSMHGNVPPIDAYDAKSSIFLVAITYNLNYQDKIIPTKEWLSIRFIPFSGNPIGDENIDLYLPSGIEVADFHCLEQLTWNDSNHTKSSKCLSTQRLYTISRLCAIRPQPLISISKQEFKQALATLRPSNKNKFTGLAFAAGCHAFLETLKNLNIKDAVLATQMHDSLYNQLNLYPEKSPLNLLSASEFLDHPAKQIHINRSRYQNYAYRYASYFLNSSQLTQSLIYLVNRGIIPTTQLFNLLPEHISPTDFIDSPKPKYLKYLGPVLASPTEATKFNVPHQQVIDYLEKNVADGPTLRFVHQVDFERALDKILAISLPKALHPSYNHVHGKKGTISTNNLAL